MIRNILLVAFLCTSLAGCFAGAGKTATVATPAAASPEAPVADVPAASADPFVTPSPSSPSTTMADSGPGVLAPTGDPERILPQTSHPTLHYGDGFSLVADGEGPLTVPAGPFTLALRAEEIFHDGVRLTMTGPLPAGIQLRLVMTSATGGPPYFYRDVKILPVQPEGHNALFKDLVLPSPDARLNFFARVNTLDPSHFFLSSDFSEALVPMTQEAYDAFWRSADLLVMGTLVPTAGGTL